MAGDALEQQFEFIHTEGLGYVVVSSVLHGLHRRLDGAIAGHYNHDRLGTPLLDTPQCIKPASAGQAQVEQNGIECLQIEHAVRLLG
jgi:hypothetical protein